MREWFEYDEVVILLKHPLDTRKFVLACCQKDKSGDYRAIENFRLKPMLTDPQVKEYIGTTLSTIENSPLCFNTQQEIRAHGIGIECHSWLATPMRLKLGVNLGYMILYNKSSSFAFDSDDARFIDGLSDSLAKIQGNFRQEIFQKGLREIKDYELEEKDKENSLSTKRLYKYTEEILKRLYGIQDLHIFHYARNNLELELSYPASEPNPDIIEIKNSILKIIQENDKQRRINYKELTVKSYFIAPMRTINSRSVGCFVFRATNIGDFTAQAIDDISDEVGEVINNNERNLRYQSLNSFGIEGARLQNLSIESILNFTHRFISSAMFTENLYIALYDKNTDEVSFPFALEDGKPWPQIQGSKRKIDRTKLGKTEEIIITQKPILHLTKAESLKWYSEPNHKEHGDNPLASWVGVPIFSEEGVVGVIAAYHSKLNYVYSERDVFFLQNIAHQVSGLFRALELGSLNKKLKYSIENNFFLKEAQEKIAETERQLTTTLIAQDIMHSVSSTVSSLGVHISEADDDIESYKKDKEIKYLTSATKNLSNAYISTVELLRTIKDVTKGKEEEIDLSKLIYDCINQVKMNKQLENILTKVTSELNPRLSSNKRTLSSIITSLLMNAADSIIEKIKITKSDYPNLFINVDIKEKNNLILIEITDNGIPIPEKQEEKIFELGFSSKNTEETIHHGYGLWRAKNFANKNGGDCILLKNNQDTKTFQLSITSNLRKKIAIVIDDQEVWIDILRKWLIKNNYEVTTASNFADASELINSLVKNKICPEIVLQDISLDKISSKNVDGIRLAKRFTDEVKPSLLALVTAYPEYSNEYKKESSIIINKIHDGLPLSYKIFWATIQKQLDKKATSLINLKAAQR